MPSGFINDGYTLLGTLKSESNSYDPISVAYRPPTGRERDIHAYQIQAAGKADDGELASDAQISFINEHFVAWDLSHNGKVLELSESTLKRLSRDLLDDMYFVLLNRKSLEGCEEYNDEESAKNSMKVPGSS